MRLVTDRPALSIGDGMDVAKAAYHRARKAQRVLASDLILTTLLYRETSVTAARIKGERAEAMRQLERAQAVVDALTESLEAFHHTTDLASRPDPTTTPEHEEQR